MFRFVTFIEPLKLWLHLGKGDSVAEGQRRSSANGPAAADEVQTKTKKYDTQRKRLFLPQWKTKWP